MNARLTVFRKGLEILNATGLGRMVAPLTQGIGAVFMLHRVLPASDRPFQPNKLLEVTPDFLVTALERIHANGYEVISLGAAVDLMKSGYGLRGTGKRYAVITFDDGFRDNAELAYPILKQAGVPFTIFVTSGFLDRTSEVWWVAMERLLADNGSLDLRDFPRPPIERLDCSDLAAKEAAWPVVMTWLTTELSEIEQRQVVRSLAQRHGLDLVALADELIMTWDQVRTLGEDPLVTLGAHTRTHPALGRLSEEEARADIESGVVRMEEELGRRPKYLAYPYGNPMAASEREFRLAEKMGFRGAVTTCPGVLRASDSKTLTALPRVSLNGNFQDGFAVDQYLTGAPFALYHAARWVKGGCGVRSGISRLFPSTR